ncbi:MAG: leucyl aminopeptidase [Actinobacteria bacterium]|nr:leucyl aminopeptidase [Actinomycetota bacterium]
MAEFTYSTQAPGSVPADVLVLPVFEGPEAGPGVRDVKGVDLLGVYAAAKLKGKKGENLLVPNLGNERLAAKAVLLLGLGKRSKATTDTLRRAIGTAAPQLARHESVATTLPQAAGRPPEDAVQATVEGLLLGPYRFDRYKSGKKEGAPEKPALRTVTVLGPTRWDRRKVRGAIGRAEIVADAVAWTRDLVNTPALDCTPDFLAKQAQEMAKEVGLEVKIWSDAELEKGGFGGVLGVGRGSERPSRLIELKYRGAGAAAPIALTGKGITFDSGGLDLKNAQGMETMKDDMAGAAAMLGVMKAVARLKPRINVIAAIPSAENMPSGSAIRPGDVLRHRGGKTSEVLNTDAEGRLVLADALAYLSESEPRVIIDTATLTGACMIALGHELYGVIGNDRALTRDLLAAGEATGEPGWELPLWEGYKSQIESSVADVQNTGERWGGAITAALFLAEFVDGTPWAHLDIAGTAFADKPGDYWPKGATGSPIRAIVHYILGQAARPKRR